MSDPALQATWKRGTWLFGGIGFVVAAVTASRNAHAITALMTIVGVTLCGLAWISTELLIRHYRPEWRLPGSERRIRLTKPSAKPRWFFIGVLIVLLLPRVIEFLENTRILQPKGSDVSIEDKRYPQ